MDRCRREVQDDFSVDARHGSPCDDIELLLNIVFQSGPRRSRWS